jgi:hypothetical protein
MGASFDERLRTGAICRTPPLASASKIDGAPRGGNFEEIGIGQPLGLLDLAPAARERIFRADPPNEQKRLYLGEASARLPLGYREG